MTRKKFHCKSEAQMKAIKASYVRRAKENSSSAPVPIDMHLAKIRNRYLFRSGSPSVEHTYAVYRDEGTKRVRVVPATHLYLPDERNMAKLHQGLLCKVKFAGYETPSGINNYYIDTNADGGVIDLSHPDVKVDKTPLPEGQARKIWSFASRKRT